jgi:hypothetical protein
VERRARLGRAAANLTVVARVDRLQFPGGLARRAGGSAGLNAAPLAAPAQAGMVDDGPVAALTNRSGGIWHAVRKIIS